MHPTAVLRIAGISLIGALAAVLSACGGGGDDSPRATVDVSTHSLSFSAQALNTSAPATQTITASLGPDVVHLSAVYTGPAIAGVTHSRSGNTAEITIIPNAPDETGAGHFNGAVAVTGYVCADAACSALPAGETETVTVGYQVSPVVRRVTPYIAIAGTSATAVVRAA